MGWFYEPRAALSSDSRAAPAGMALDRWYERHAPQDVAVPCG